jgi:hypothetical protein
MGDCNGLLVGGATDDGVQGWVREEIVGREATEDVDNKF